jgi:hypothetical protein
MIPLGKVASLARECQSLINDMVSACCSEEFCIDESIFVSPGRLHFTLLMLRLHTTQEVERAKATLCAMEKDVAKIFAGAGGSTFHFGGLHYMNDDPTQVHVLYLGMQPKGTAGASAVSGNGTETVQALVQLLNDRFTREGFALESDVARNSKIHATIMNTKWRRSAASSSNDNVPLSAPVADNARVAFNATNVLHLFGGASLGVHRMDRVELCALRGSASSGGFYPCEAFIPIP